MKGPICVGVLVGTLLLAAANGAPAQQPASPQAPQSQQGASMNPGPAPHGHPGPHPMGAEHMQGPMGHGMMGQGMGMMCPMMNAGAGTMGSVDPKTMGRMLQLRGEMLRAMGEVLLKHGKAMEEGK